MKRYILMTSTWIILTAILSWLSKVLDFPKDRENITVFIIISIITGVFTVVTSAMSSDDRGKL